MARYNFYSELRENLGAVLRRQLGISKKKMRKLGKDPVDAAMRLAFSDPRNYQSLEFNVLMDEEDHIRLGRRVFIPESKDLIEMLWRSKMEVDPDDLEGFPQCFSIAWPKNCVIDGVKLPGCLVWFGEQGDRVKVASLMQKWMPFQYKAPTEEEMKGSSDWWTSGRGFHLSYAQGEAVEKRMTVRMSVPPDILVECLKSEMELASLLNSHGFPEAVSLSPEDIHEQRVLARCVANLMVYTTACPDAVRSGWPDDVGSSPHTRGRKPLTLASPVQKEHQGGAHASPEAHLRAGRDPYFRSYPRRKDGMKKKGIYLVGGHGPVMVNAEVDPSTIKGKTQ